MAKKKEMYKWRDFACTKPILKGFTGNIQML